MYRSRLRDNLNDVTLDYVSSINDDLEIALYDILGSQAHVIMLYEKNIISKIDVKKILLALEELKEEKFDTKNGSEDIHELIETLVIKKAGMKSGGKMHTARSRNDQVALDIRMKIRDDINLLSKSILDVIESLLVLAKNNQKTIMPLYTHLQQAQAGLLSHYLLSYADLLIRDYGRMADSYKRINTNPLGAGPVGGTSIPIDRAITSKLLGFSGIVENSIDATSNRDVVIEFVSNIAIMMTGLSKIAEDFVIWSTTEFSFIELADQFTSPSSVMPQKKNPDILELTRGKTAQIIGNLAAMLATVKGLATGYGRDLQQFKSSIWSSSKTALQALILIHSILDTVTINDKQMKRSAESGYLVALDLAEKLVIKGVPFREAHKIAGRLVQKAAESKIPISKISESDFKKSLDSSIDVETIFEILKNISIKSSLKERISLGSSGFEEQKRMLKDRQETLGLLRADLEEREKEITESISNLKKLVVELTK